jgi:hypothetical protein
MRNAQEKVPYLGKKEIVACQYIILMPAMGMVFEDGMMFRVVGNAMIIADGEVAKAPAVIP